MHVEEVPVSRDCRDVVLRGSNSPQGPCAHDGLSARLIERAGFKFMFMSGFCVSASQLGMPDAGLMSCATSDVTPTPLPLHRCVHRLRKALHYRSASSRCRRRDGRRGPHDHGSDSPAGDRCARAVSSATSRMCRRIPPTRLHPTRAAGDGDTGYGNAMNTKRTARLPCDHPEHSAPPRQIRNHPPLTISIAIAIACRFLLPAA